jgi:FAD/FMN-containing dehydrogenase
MAHLELSSSDLAAFTAQFSGAVIGPDAEEYDAARHVWNGMIDRYPALIVRPQSTEDVAAAIRLARDHGLPIAVRGGSHNVAGSGVCDTGVVIDLRELASVVVDPAAATIRAGGGCTWGQFDAAAAEHGLATTGGLISTTGVGGLTLGGGIGWLVRAYGFSCDNLVSAEVVTADGKTVLASASENADLFWALRGGGGNFGVVTSFIFQGHPVETVLGGLMLYRGDRAAEVLAAYARWTPDVPEEMTTLAAFLTAPPAPFVPESLQFQPAFAVLLCHIGDHAAGEAVLAPLRASCPPDADAIGPMPYPALQGMLDAGAPHGQRNYWKSGYLSELGPDLQADLVVAAGRMPTPFDQIHLHQLGGTAASKTDGALGHRDAAFAVNVIGAGFEPEHDAPNTAWVRETWATVEPATSGAYVNFLAGDDADRVRSAYDDDVWDRLREVKRAWDPDNVFRINHNIPPA